eukprot:gnl/TRDRNA2_/TRDRNA2_200860_c0_seq1.p1 gnl/TRDRNA2_/TRDRNA2_200860_c0~~gnl/TRDRNA2_/TRDRNA2_200860_c0_seq1.p1  ORF type:complete len:386 (-),score=19.47 gnl/TRDRNA2_/TRDRNA2_200860_c0_seq1:177-1334(-)
MSERNRSSACYGLSLVVRILVQVSAQSAFGLQLASEWRLVAMGPGPIREWCIYEAEFHASASCADAISSTPGFEPMASGSLTNRWGNEPVLFTPELAFDGIVSWPDAWMSSQTGPEPGEAWLGFRLRGGRQTQVGCVRIHQSGYGGKGRPYATQAVQLEYRNPIGIGGDDTEWLAVAKWYNVATWEWVELVITKASDTWQNSTTRSPTAATASEYDATTTSLHAATTTPSRSGATTTSLHTATTSSSRSGATANLSTRTGISVATTSGEDGSEGGSVIIVPWHVVAPFVLLVVCAGSVWKIMSLRVATQVSQPPQSSTHSHEEGHGRSTARFLDHQSADDTVIGVPVHFDDAQEVVDKSDLPARGVPRQPGLVQLACSDSKSALA